jgi:hypothetical protein
MTKADRLCIKVALVPVLTFIVGLLGLMILRVASNASPLPDSSAEYIVGGSLFVTFGVIVAANLLRVRLAR